MSRFGRLFWGRSSYYELGASPEGWTGRYLSTLQVVPFAGLGVALVLSQLAAGISPRDRLVTVGLAAAAAAWVYVLYTRLWPQWLQPTAPMLVYFSGLLVLGWFLEARSPFFSAFMIVGFLQAFFVLPAGLAVIATAATSCVIYIAPSHSGWTDPKTWPFLAFLVLLQTAAITGGSYVGVRINREQELRSKMVAELEAALRENAGLHAQLLAQAHEAGVLDERQRLAAEIHDTLAQGLAGIITQLEAADGLEGNPRESRDHLAKARTLARQSLSEARRSVQALRPGELEGSGLEDAIGRLAKEWSASTGVAAEVQTVGTRVALRPEVEVVMFRVAQEALTNVAKHARATHVGLTVSYLDDTTRLDVRDDGVGFDGEPDNSGDRQSYGLRAMRQRVRQIGGNIDVESTRGGGTAISVSVPRSAVSVP